MKTLGILVNSKLARKQVIIAIVVVECVQQPPIVATRGTQHRCMRDFSDAIVSLKRPVSLENKKALLIQLLSSWMLFDFFLTR